MATRSKSSASSKSGTLFGLVIGLVIGLAVAVVAALYMTNAPIPFRDQIAKTTQDVEDLLSTGGYGVNDNVGSDADPNKGLYGGTLSSDLPIFSGKEAQIASELGKIAAPAPTLSAPVAPVPPVPKVPTAPKKPESLDNLIAQLNEPVTATATAAATAYYLQAGAFRSAQDAQTMQARILLMGLNASVQAGSYEGGTINRVRVGPFKGVDDMNRARATLSKEKIETSVVRP